MRLRSSGPLRWRGFGKIVLARQRFLENQARRAIPGLQALGLDPLQFLLRALRGTDGKEFGSKLAVVCLIQVLELMGFGVRQVFKIIRLRNLWS